MKSQRPREIPALIMMLLVACAGCNSGTTSQPAEAEAKQQAPEPERQDGMTAVEIVERMVGVYRDTTIYMDNAEYGEHFVLAEDGVKRQGQPMTVSVLFKRPNRFRITRVQPRSEGPPERAVVACDGQQLEAQVSRLAKQRLQLSAPENATLESITPDPVLHEALFPGPVQDLFPQLALLLVGEDRTPWPLEGRAGLVLLPQKEIRSQGRAIRDCYRVHMPTTMGPQVCWIDKQTFLLLRIELTNKELQEHLYPHHKFTKFVWQFDFYDVTLETQTSKKLFRLDPLEEEGDVQVVAELQEPKPEGGADAASQDENGP